MKISIKGVGVTNNEDGCSAFDAFEVYVVANCFSYFERELNFRDKNVEIKLQLTSKLVDDDRNYVVVCLWSFIFWKGVGRL